MLSDHDLLVTDVILSWQVLGLFIENEALHIVLMRVVTNGPLTMYDEVDFCHIALFVQNETIVGIVVELAWHKAESDLVDEI